MTDKTAPEPELEFVEIYATHNLPQAQIVEDLLHDHTIRTMSRKIEVSMFPMTVGTSGEIRVSVAQEDVEEALQHIAQAVADGVVNTEDSEILVMTHQ